MKTKHTLLFPLLFVIVIVSSTANNALASKDEIPPNITSVALKDMTKKVGDTDTLYITVETVTDDKYALISGIVGGYYIDSIQKVDNTTIYAFFNVTSRAYEIDSSESVHVYNLQVADSTGNLSNELDTFVANPNHAIYSKLPTAQFSGDASACHMDSIDIPIILNGHAPFSILYTDGTNSVAVNEIFSNFYFLRIKADHSIGDPLTYTITDVTDATGNNSVGTGNFILDIDTLPEANFATPIDNDVYDVSLDSVELIGNYDGGLFYGPGVFANSNIFSPQMAEVGYHDLIYVYEDGNGCKDSDTVTVRVIEGGSITFTQHKKIYCSYVDTFSVTGYNNLGNPGSFSLTPSVGGALINIAIDTAIIKPELLYPRSWTLNYTYAGGDTIKTTFFIEELSGLISFTPIDDQCEEFDTIHVQATNIDPPEGMGIFTLSDGSVDLHPSNNGNETYILGEDITPGTYTMDYSYVSPNGCTNDWTINDIFEIYALPSVDLVMDTLYNIVGGIQSIKGTPGVPAGSFSGENINDNADSTATFDPQILGLGDHSAYYTYTDLNNCSTTAVKEFQIDEADAEILGLNSYNGNNQYCYGDIDDIIWAIAANGDGTPGTFSIDGQVISDIIGMDSISLNVAEVGANDHVLKFTYTKGVAEFSVQDTFNIDSIGNIYFTGLDTVHYEDEEPVELTGIYPGESGFVAFSGIGIYDNFTNDFGYFYPNETGPGDYTITYVFTRYYSGCQKTFTQNVIVKEAIDTTSTFINDPVEFSYTIYPNPVYETLSLELPIASNKELVIELYNNAGLLVKSEKIPKYTLVKNLNTSNLASGIYYLKLMDTNTIVGVNKIVVARE